MRGHVTSAAILTRPLTYSSRSLRLRWSRASRRIPFLAKDKFFVDCLGHAATNLAFMLWGLKRNEFNRTDLQNAAMVVSPAHSSGSSKKP
jgi:hypothetical protein